MDKEGCIDFSDLGEEAERLADANPDSDEVITVQTSKGNHYGFAYKVLHGDEASEDAFLNMLREKDDCVVERLVCMWTECRGVEIPCCRFQKKLVNLDRRNLDLRFVALGDHGYCCPQLGKKISWERFQGN